MRIIKVNAINSTNSFAKEMYRDNFVKLPTCIMANEQLQGRGQRGSSWIAKAGENLTFSIIYPQIGVEIDHQFKISAAVAVAIFNAFESLNIKKLKIKWPNDIMAENKKIGGILIENFISNGRINTSIIGIGLNINQETFDNLPLATSLRMLTGEKFNLVEVLNLVLAQIEKTFIQIKTQSFSEIKKNYHQHLFRIKKPSTFQLPNQTNFIGIIEGVAQSGKLRVLVEDDQIREFDIKEIKLLY